MAAQCLEEGLKATANQTAHDSTVYLHAADSSGALDNLGGRRAYKTDLDPAYRQLLGHACHATRRGRAAKSGELLIEC